MMDPIAFGGSTLDRADHLRAMPEEIARLRADPRARLLGLDGLFPLLDGAALARAGLHTLPDDAELVFLGFEDQAPLFAAVPAQGDAGPASIRGNVWGMLTMLPPSELAIYGGARSVVDWHARHRFCACCGAATKLVRGGWQRECPACRAQHFPRTDPVAIMLVEHDGDLLLGRQARFPPRSYSALAGFVEPGETMEETVAREVLEETGVSVRNVRYIGSQPWPFPSQLMLGCHALAEGRALRIAPEELEDAAWFTRAQVEEALEGGPDSASFVAPPRFAIANLMLRWWLERSPGA